MIYLDFVNSRPGNSALGSWGVAMTMKKIANGFARLLPTAIEVPDEMFGANFLFARDGSADGSNVDAGYRGFVDETNLTTLRYPGGTMAETLFDLGSPDRPQSISFHTSPGEYEQTFSMQNFLVYAGSVGASATIVVPTYRFLTVETDELGHRAANLEADSEVRQFIRYVLDLAAETGVEIRAFEIGNEWYVDNSNVFGFRMTPVEYGRVSSFISQIVHEEMVAHFGASEAEISPSPNIVVQVGPGGAAERYTENGFRASEDYDGTVVSATELIFCHFSSEGTLQFVDGVLSHRYLHGGDETINGWAYRPFDNWSYLAAAIGDTRDFERYVTEWNVSTSNDTEVGIRQFDTMVGLISEMLYAGVDHANVWSVQQNNRTRMVNNTGVGDEEFGGLSFGGLAFEMMSNQIRDLSFTAQSVMSSDLSSYIFESDTKAVAFFSNRSDENGRWLIDPSTFAQGVSHVSVHIISESQAGLTVVSIRTISAGGNGASFFLELPPGGSAVVSMVIGSGGVTVKGYGGNDILNGAVSYVFHPG